jgi:hypothetical protein
MPISLVKEKWHFMLGVIKGFITCEGRYSLFFIYHFRLLMVFMDYELNMSVFLLKSLSKMAHFYQRKNLSSERNVFHHGLVKILIEFQLKQNGDFWEDFVKRNHFQENSESDLQTHNSEVEFETLNPVEDIVLSYPQFCFSAKRCEGYTQSSFKV